MFSFSPILPNKGYLVMFIPSHVKGWALMLLLFLYWGCGCRQFKLKMQQQEKRKDDARWNLLVRKVVSAKAISSLALPKRKRSDQELQLQDQTHNHGMRSFRL